VCRLNANWKKATEIDTELVDTTTGDQPLVKKDDSLLGQEQQILPPGTLKPPASPSPASPAPAATTPAATATATTAPSTTASAITAPDIAASVGSGDVEPPMTKPLAEPANAHTPVSEPANATTPVIDPTPATTPAIEPVVDAVAPAPAAPIGTDSAGEQGEVGHSSGQ
jgi:hypothetical protein